MRENSQFTFTPSSSKLSTATTSKTAFNALPNFSVRSITFVLMNSEEPLTSKELTVRPAPKHLAQGARLVRVRVAGWQANETYLFPNGMHMIIIAVGHVASHVPFACGLEGWR